MDYYKIADGLWSTIKRFASLEEAQAFAATKGPNATAEFHLAYEAPSIPDRLKSDIDFGSSLIFTFVEDNRIAETTQEQNDALLVKFRDILAFAQTGSIESINVHLPNIVVDEVFTQERKDKYLAMVTDYLSQL